VSARGKAKRILAIDWDARTLRVVHAVLGKRGVSVDRILSVAIPSDVDPANPPDLGRHIRRVLDQESITTRHAIVDIPREQAILKTLTLPSARPNELAGMVALQIAKELPFPASQAAIDFAVALDTDATTVEVLVAAVRTEVVEQYRATFQAAGLRLDRIGLRPYANKVALCKLLQFDLPERVLFIDVRPSLTEIDVLRRGVLAFSRAASVLIPPGAADAPRLSIVRDRPPTDGPGGATGADATDDRAAGGSNEIINALVVEVTRSIEAYRAGDSGATIDHVVIGGDVGVEEMLAEAIQKRLDVTTELYNPASSFGWDADEGAGASAFAATLGLVLGHADTGALHVDFLHPKKTTVASQERLRKAPLVAAVVALFLIAGVVAVARATRAERSELQRIESTIADLKRTQSTKTKFLDLAEELRAFDDDQQVWVDVLYDVFSVLPSHQELVVTHVELNQRDGKVTLKTKAKSLDTYTGLIERLNAFRREGRKVARFTVEQQTQSEKPGDMYPIVLPLTIILHDDVPRTTT